MARKIARHPNQKLRQARTNRGWHQSSVVSELRRLQTELGENEDAIRANPDHVGMWERGEAQPRLFYASRLCLIFECHPDQIGLPAHPELLQSINDLNHKLLGRRQLLVVGAATIAGPLLSVWQTDDEHLHTRPTSALDRAQLDGLQTLTHAYIRQMHTIAPANLLPQLRGHLATLHRLISHPQPSALRRNLLATTAEAEAVAGKLSFGLGNYGDAFNLYAEAERLAIEAGHTALRAYVLGQTSHLHSSFWHTGPGSPVALSLLDAAIASCAASSSPLLTVWLSVRRAEEHAAAGDASAAYRDLDNAQNRLAQATTDDTGFFLHWQSASEARLAGYRGNCERVLNRPKRAADIIHQAIAQVDPSFASVRTTMMADLASAYARQGEVAQACDVVAQALSFASQSGLLPHVNRLVGVRRELAKWSKMPAVKQLDEQLRERVGGTNGEVRSPGGAGMAGRPPA